jgi:hypothetical protein
MRDEVYALGLVLADILWPVVRRAARVPDAGAGMGRRVERAPAVGAGMGQRVERALEGVAGPGLRTQASRVQRGAEAGDAVEEAEEHVRKRRKRVRSAEVMDIDE